MRRVVITGLGTVNALGNDVETSWQSLLKGVSGVTAIERFDTSDLTAKVAGQVRGFDPTTVLDKKEVRRLDTVFHYTMAAATEAMSDSGLEIDESNADRVACMVGSGIAGLETIYDTSVVLHERGAPRVSPFFVPGSIANMASGLISIRWGARGPNTCVVTACATGTHSIGDAFRTIQRGDADAAIAGGVEAPVNRIGLSGFCSMRAVTTWDGDPAGASRPFDKTRDGFVCAEGGGIVILESLEHALARGARIYAEVVGYGLSGDAHHMTAPHPEGLGAIACMKMALADAGLEPGDVDYINAHGTSTPLNDRTESQAIRTVFGAHADRLAVSSTKSMTGHALGAAGGIEAIFTALTVRDGKLPPTINYREPDPECDLDYVPNEMRETPVRAALTNSFGFGGTNATLALRRWDGE